MSDKKLTDNEIVKAYELCFAEKGTSYTCAVCPYHHFGKLCKVNRDKDALDLINRLQAENERLQKNLEEAHLDIKEQRAGIESLEAENRLLIDRNCELAEKGEKAVITFVKSQNQIKAEAYKEFAELLHCYCEGVIIKSGIAKSHQILGQLLMESLKK